MASDIKKQGSFFFKIDIIIIWFVTFYNSEPGDLGDLHDDAHGEVNATRTFDWLTIGHNDGILGRSLAVRQTFDFNI